MTKGTIIIFCGQNQLSEIFDYFKVKDGTVRQLIWKKTNPSNIALANKQPMKYHEIISVFYKKPTIYNPQFHISTPYNKGMRKEQTTDDVYGKFNQVVVESTGIRYPRNVIYFKTAESEGEVVHPTQKPIELGRYLVRTYTNPGDIVLDNTFGSGSFLVAALMEGRNFIGIEKNEDVALFKKDNINYIDVAKHRLFFAWNELSKKAKKGIAVTNLISEFEEK